jgi:hypothetical protein
VEIREAEKKARMEEVFDKEEMVEYLALEVVLNLAEKVK